MAGINTVSQREAAWRRPIHGGLQTGNSYFGSESLLFLLS